jgi:2-dehydro-3-deoxyphosphooctonate aldolase (KDO 8-P synthase)
MTHSVRIGDWSFGKDMDFLVIAGPCVIETEGHAIRMADSLKKYAEKAGVPFVFKASYDKANRTSFASFLGPGVQEGLRILSKIKRETGVKVLSDVHAVEEVGVVAEVLDVIQTPAYLCRQTDLLIAVGRAGKAVNVKKGQFLAPWDMEHVVQKIRSTGNENILITERGSCFGYNQLVNDMRSLRIMRSFGFPVVFDASHSVQLPGARGHASGGQREFILPLARGAVAVGVDGVFLEVHDKPDKARCDSANSFPLRHMPEFLEQVLCIQEMVKKWEARRDTSDR